MRITPNEDLTIAFAGIFQSAALAHQIATVDRHDSRALHESIYSLLRMDAVSTEAIYGSKRGVNLGLRTLVKIFSTQADESTREIFQYTVGMHQLSMKLAQFPKTADAVGADLSELQSLYLRHYGNEEEDGVVCEKIAAVYSRHISTLTPRILVRGAQGKLEDPDNANKVRTALFSGIRSAYLWHQLGGRRWHLLFTRKEYQRIASGLLMI